MRDETGRVTLGWLRWLKAPGLRSGHYVFEGSNPSPSTIRLLTNHHLLEGYIL